MFFPAPVSARLLMVEYRMSPAKAYLLATGKVSEG